MEKMIIIMKRFDRCGLDIIPAGSNLCYSPFMVRFSFFGQTLFNPAELHL